MLEIGYEYKYMFVSVRERGISYKIGEKIENSRLMQGYTQKELSRRIGLTYQEMNNYELGNVLVPIEVAYRVAKELSVSITDLLPEGLVVRNRSYYDDDEEIFYLSKIYGKIKDQQLRKVMKPMIRSVYISQKINQEEVKIEVAKNLAKEEVSVEIIYQATGLSIYEYDDKEKEVCTDSIHYKVGQRIKERRLIRRYTKKDLAEKVRSTEKEIYKYEKGYKAVEFDKLYEIADALSVDIRALLPKTKNETEDELASFVNEYRKIEHQNELLKSLSKRIEINKEKIQKAEKIKIARALIKAGVSVQIICKATELDDDEFDG